MRGRLTAAAGITLAAALALAGCASVPAADHDDHDHEGHDHGSEAAAVETAGPKPRLVMTYDGGLLVVDATTLEPVADIEIDGFNRVSPAGDGRHVLVSTAGGWQVLDAGVWTQAHGDHGHSYEAEPRLTDLKIAAEAPGHVVSHAGTTTLFDDGTGAVTVLETGDWAAAVEHGHTHVLREHSIDEAHHGVAVALGDELFVTVGGADARTGAALLDADGGVVAESDQCPGIHGEAALDDLVITGCEDGVLVLHGDHFHKIDAPGDFGRIGNIFTAADSTVALGDFKDDPETGIALSDIALIDLDQESLQIVETGSTYTWRGLARGIDGSALVLGTDGELRVFDADTGELRESIPVIDAWTPPTDWQVAHPSLIEHDGFAYVLDPATQTIHRIDYAAGEVRTSADLPQAPNEVALADAAMPAAAGGDDGDDHEGHDHGDEDHDHDHGDEGHDHDDH